MLTNEERIAELHSRAAGLRQKRRSAQVLMIQAAGAFICFAGVIVLSFFMPGLTASFTDNYVHTGMSASMFSGSSSLGYIVIAVIAFVLGAAVTVFCFKLKKWNNEKAEEDGR